jgi:integral membrane protein (TIGR00529 family)
MMAVVGVILAFAIIIALRLRNVDFTLSILVGGAVVTLTSGMPPQFVLEAAMETLKDPMTLNIMSAVALITVLSYMLKETGTMAELIEGLRGILPVRVLLSIIPAMFGILAMPGGALMSAPFNEPEAERLKLKPEHKTFINVWFRHIWYWASPLSPVTILTASIACYTINDFVIAQLPIFPVSLAIGFIITRLFLKKNVQPARIQKGYPEIVNGLSPIALAVLLSIAGVPLWISLLAGIAALIFLTKLPISRVPGMAMKGVKWDTVFSAFAILYFRYIVTGSGSVESLFDYIAGFNIPLIAIFIVVPVLVGAISGTPTMATGILLPLFLPLCSGSINLISLVYSGLIAGYIASPMHLCLVLTNSYYKSELGKVYRYLVPAVVIQYLATLVYHLTLYGGIPL